MTQEHKIKVMKNGYTGFKRPNEKSYYWVTTGSNMDKSLRRKFKQEIKKINK